MMWHVWLSLSVGAAATLLSLPPAVLVSWIIERTRWPGREVLQTLVLLPLVLPPVVTGYLLLWLFSPRGALGKALETIGLPVAFHWLGAVIASSVVGFPLLVMLTSLALKSIDPRLETVSLSCGRGPLATFFRVTLPLAWPGILAGVVLAFARSLGEFGATIVLAGHIPGETDTIALAVYALLDRPGGEKEVQVLVAVSVALSAAAVLVARSLDLRYRVRLELQK